MGRNAAWRMRILLVTPENPFIRAFRRGQLNNFAQLTMAHLAGFVRPPHTVRLLDEYTQVIDFELPCDLVGITCSTPNAGHVYRMADRFRERGKRVVLGGPHPTLLPDEASPHADAVVIGEGEDLWPKVIEDAERGCLAPRYQSTAPPSLQGLPHARRDLIADRGFLAHTTIATRGCPHRCAYCNLRQLYHPSLRFRPVEDVVDEIRAMASPIFAFWDDQLFANPDYAHRLFAGVAGLRRQWAAMVTLASTADEALLAAAAHAGCACLFIGLESFSARSLALANKVFNVVASYAESIARVHAHGIAVQAGIMFGFDDDEEDCFTRTFDEATRLGLDGATVSLLTPFPRTPLFAELERDGRLLTRDWSYFNGKTAVVFQPARMTPEALWNGYMGFRRRFFSASCTHERLRRSGVRTLQSWLLNWGYARALDNPIRGWPIPGGRRQGLDWTAA
jgi:radical SAM superfamily enzyme YgiQ (UPF0313 family)